MKRNTSIPMIVWSATALLILTGGAQGQNEAQGVPMVRWLVLSNELLDTTSPLAILATDPGFTLRKLIRQLDKIATADSHTGVVPFLDRPLLSFNQVQEIRRAVVRDMGLGCLADGTKVGTATWLNPPPPGPVARREQQGNDAARGARAEPDAGTAGDA